ncbi:hypothetical protein PW52_09625 [Tamlana sedimentorum]|uniref:Uncharacterized protein n=1 Tax=Neotamlana sedimentorum TaxID=1435349 RepID=A0A0D7W8B6_9FLAO|nr:hypothetical protein PW52_09625 [Tamlana sedimentorum]
MALPNASSRLKKYIKANIISIKPITITQYFFRLIHIIYFLSVPLAFKNLTNRICARIYKIGKG